MNKNTKDNKNTNDDKNTNNNKNPEDNKNSKDNKNTLNNKNLIFFDESKLNYKYKGKLSLFDQYVKKDNTHLIPFNERYLYLGSVKYLPPLSKEWKNTIYAFNINNLKNLPAYDKNIFSLISGYFNSFLFFKTIDTKFIPRSIKMTSFNKIFFSKAEVKHTHSKAIITIFTYNREKLSIIEFFKGFVPFDRDEKKEFRTFKKYFYGKNLYEKSQYLKRWNYQHSLLNSYFFNRVIFNVKILIITFNKIFFKLFIPDSENMPLTEDSSENIPLTEDSSENIPLTDDSTDYPDPELLEFFFLTKSNFIKHLLYTYILLVRKCIIIYDFNKFKFKEKLLYVLSHFISKYYNKKVEFNIINLKSLILNSDIFTKILTLKLKRKPIIDPGFFMSFILSKAVLPEVNRILEKNQEKRARVKGVDFNLWENTFFNINLNYLLSKNKFSLERLLGEIFNKNVNLRGKIVSNLDINYHKISEIIFNSIKYKNIGGILLIASGRLTRRYRADRAVYKVRRLGGLKNIDSSYRGLSSVEKRGFMKPNVEYSIFTSKRIIGSFAVKGWISGR